MKTIFSFFRQRGYIAAHLLILLDNLATTEILEQVELICNSPEIKTKKLACSFLRFVVNETLEGRGDQLKGYTIGVSVLGKDQNFDPEQDSLVRIHAGRLRRLLHTYYLDAGKNDPIYIDIPKGGYHPVFKRIDEALANANAAHESQNILKREPSIAVFPFKNLTGDPDKEYIAYGLSEELSLELTNYEDLKIINCWHRPDFATSENAYEKIGARYVIDGSVQAYDERLHILVKLVDIRSDTQIWAERYSRDLSVQNIVFIQEDIAETVAKTIGSEVGIVFTHLTEESRLVKPESLEVLDAILHYYFYQSHMSAPMGTLTFTKLNQAVINNPSSGLIHALLAEVYWNSYALDYPESDGYLEKSIELIDLALQLDPDNYLVRIINSVRFFFLDEKDRFLREANHCLSMNISSPLMLGGIGLYLSVYGYWDRGKTVLDKVMRKNIGYPKYLHAPTCLNYYRQKEYEQAMTEAENYDIPGAFWGPMLRACCLGQLGKRTKAKAQIEDVLLLKPDFEEKASYLIRNYVKEGNLVDEVLGGLRKAGLKL
jgi:TolB-like protein